MAGVLDFIFNKEHFRNKRTDELASQYKSLLDQYSGSQNASGMLSPMTSSPQSGPQGLMGGPQGVSGQLAPQFYQEVAAIPGYEQFGLQDQVGGQNMQRQMQAQQNEQQYMSASQAAQLAQQDAQYQQGFNNLSAADQARVGAMKQEREAVQSRWAQDRADKLPGGLLADPGTMPVPAGWQGTAKPPKNDLTINPNWTPDSGAPQWVAIPGTERFIKEQSAVNAYSEATGWFARAEALNAVGGFNQPDNQEAFELMADFNNNVLPAMMDALNTGALQKSDVDMAKESANDFTKRVFDVASPIESLSRLTTSDDRLQREATAGTKSGSKFYTGKMMQMMQLTGQSVPSAAEFLDTNGEPPPPGTPEYFTYLAIKEQENASKKRRGR